MRYTLHFSTALFVGFALYGYSGEAQVMAANRSTQRPVHQSATAVQTLQLREVLNQFKARYRVDILFEDKIINDQLILASLADPSASLEKNLESVLRPQGLRFKNVKSGVYMVLAEKAFPASHH